MKKQLNEKQLEELTHIRDWCLTIVDFMIRKYGGQLIFTAMLKDVINNEYDAQNLRGMRCVYRDMNEGTGALSLREIEELNKILYAKFGEDLHTCSKRNLSKINKIIKRGRIANEDEFRLVLGRVDEIYADSTKEEEVEMLNVLLKEFELSQK